MIYAAAGELLEDAEADTLAYLDFFYEHHIRIRTNNVQERTNREIKRRSCVVQLFSSNRSLLHYVAGALSEMDEGWHSSCWLRPSRSRRLTSRSRSVHPQRYRPTKELQPSMLLSSLTC